MLVIRRAEGESLLLSGGVEIRVLEAGPRKVVLGIAAPPEIIVLRKEVAETGRVNHSAAMASGQMKAADLARIFRQRE